MKLGTYLRKERGKTGLSLRQAAARSGIDFTYLSKIENGIDNPSEETLRSLAGTYDLDPVALIRRAGRIPREITDWLLQNPAAVSVIQDWMSQ